MSKKSRKIYVVGDDAYYINWMQGQLTHDMNEADLVVFTGGEDVSPSFYNQPMHVTTYTNPNRDVYERAEFLRAQAMNKHMIGICRGAQFLCVMAGGMLIQHQENPNGFHRITTYTDDKYYITSTHHQAQYPWRLKEDEYRVLGWSTFLQSKYHLGGNDEEMILNVVPENKEVEIGFYPKIKAYCIQGHPENMTHKYGDILEVTKTIDFLRNQLDLFLKDQLLNHHDTVLKEKSGKNR